MADDPMDWVHCTISRECRCRPAERKADVPAAISAIVMKLLAKAAEERYQTAAGLERDLGRCLAEWEARAYIEDFSLRPAGVAGAPADPRKALRQSARCRHVARLASIASSSMEPPNWSWSPDIPELASLRLSTKCTSCLVPPRGLFASGKFDQHQSEIPYATFAQAFQGLIHPLLGKSEADLSEWRSDFLQALGSNGFPCIEPCP